MGHAVGRLSAKGKGWGYEGSETLSLRARGVARCVPCGLLRACRLWAWLSRRRRGLWVTAMDGPAGTAGNYGWPGWYGGYGWRGGYWRGGYWRGGYWRGGYGWRGGTFHHY
jgi:hypothetical protein